jgi:hypothetical protein
LARQPMPGCHEFRWSVPSPFPLVPALDLARQVPALTRALVDWGISQVVHEASLGSIAPAMH